ncbi:hypothetical protein F4823DRAFT_638850 [Ustulina deusta]|nr:hypothetical protein F4823DRAFT_638850 [Ustulina deusta]
MSQTTQSNTWLDQIPEVLLGIISHLNDSSRINLAIAYPEVFLRPGFNIFEQDAEMQVRRQDIQLGDLTPFDSSDPEDYNDKVVEVEGMIRDRRPLLYTAIENNISIPVIREILRAYRNICATSIDGIWSNMTDPSVDYLTLYEIPLIFATGLAKPHVVSLLLDEGANPWLHASIDTRTRKNIHAQCQHGADTSCTTAMQVAFFRAAWFLQNCQALEECALLLNGSGVPFLMRSQNDGWVRDKFLDQLSPPLEAGFDRIVRAIVDPEATLRNEQEPFREVLATALRRACSCQKQDDGIDIIEHLVFKGAPLIRDSILPPGERIIPFEQTLVGTALSHDSFRTAAFLLEYHICTYVPIDFESLAFNYLHELEFGYLDSFDVSEGLLRIVKDLYGAMIHAAGGGFSFLRGRKASFEELHSCLLTEVIFARNPATTQWLITKIVETPGQLPTDLSALDGDVERAQADHRHMWKLVGSSSICLQIKERLAKTFKTMYDPMTYEQSSQTITSDMLQPEYFASRNSDRRRALFHYLLG